MVIAFESESDYYEGTNTVNHVITLPSFSTDELVILAVTQPGGSTQGTWTAGVTGWTALTPVTGGGSQLGQTRFWYRIMQGGDGTTATYNINPGGGGLQIGVLGVCYSGTATGVPFDIVSTFVIGSVQNPLSPDVTTSSTNTMILRYIANDDDGDMVVSTAFGAITDRGFRNYPDAGAGNGGDAALGEEGIQSSAGATGTFQWTTSTGEGSLLLTIAIRDVANDVTSVSNQLTVLYDMTQLASNQLTVLYDMDGSVSNTLTGVYDMRQFANNQLTGLYDMDEFVSNQLTGVYDLRTLVTNQLTGIYDIFSIVSNQLTGKYANGGVIANTLTGLYDMKEFVSNQLTGLYDMRQLVSKNLTLKYQIQEFVSNTLTMKYNIQVFVSNQLTGVYDNLISVSNQLTGKYENGGIVSNILTGIYDIFIIHKQGGFLNKRSTSGSKDIKSTSGTT